MGNCIVSVHVTGSHHNGESYDIDQMAAKFVDELKVKHNVTAATIVAGGESNLLNSASRLALKAAGAGA